MKSQPQTEPSNLRKKPSSSNSNEWMRYAGLGLQLVGSIAVCMFIGYWLDRWIEPKFPIFILSFSILGIVVAMAMLFRLNSKRK